MNKQSRPRFPRVGTEESAITWCEKNTRDWSNERVAFEALSAYKVRRNKRTLRRHSRRARTGFFFPLRGRCHARPLCNGAPLRHWPGSARGFNWLARRLSASAGAACRKWGAFPARSDRPSGSGLLPRTGLRRKRWRHSLCRPRSPSPGGILNLADAVRRTGVYLGETSDLLVY